MSIKLFQLSGEYKKREKPEGEKLQQTHRTQECAGSYKTEKNWGGLFEMQGKG